MRFFPSANWRRALDDRRREARELIAKREALPPSGPDETLQQRSHRLRLDHEIAAAESLITEAETGLVDAAAREAAETQVEETRARLKDALRRVQAQKRRTTKIDEAARSLAGLLAEHAEDDRVINEARAAGLDVPNGEQDVRCVRGHTTPARFERRTIWRNASGREAVMFYTNPKTGKLEGEPGTTPREEDVLVEDEVVTPDFYPPPYVASFVLPALKGGTLWPRPAS